MLCISSHSRAISASSGFEPWLTGVLQRANQRQGKAGLTCCLIQDHHRSSIARRHYFVFHTFSFFSAWNICSLATIAHGHRMLWMFAQFCAHSLTFLGAPSFDMVFNTSVVPFLFSSCPIQSVIDKWSMAVYIILYFKWSRHQKIVAQVGFGNSFSPVFTTATDLVQARRSRTRFQMVWTHEGVQLGWHCLALKVQLYMCIVFAPLEVQTRPACTKMQRQLAILRCTTVLFLWHLQTYSVHLYNLIQCLFDFM